MGEISILYSKYPYKPFVLSFVSVFGRHIQHVLNKHTQNICNKEIKEMYLLKDFNPLLKSTIRYWNNDMWVLTDSVTDLTGTV